MSLPLITHNVNDWIRQAAIAINQLSRNAYHYTPIDEPNNPVAGMTYFDKTSNKLRTYDGTVWQVHW